MSGDSEKREDSGSNKPRYRFENFEMEIDPTKIDEALRTLTTRARELVDQGRYTKVRLKFRGKPILPDVPLGVFVATEAATLWSTGLLYGVLVNLGVRAIIEVEFIHDAVGRVAEGVELYMAGEIELAEEKYREALRMKKDDGSALYNLGVLLRVTGRRDESLACFEKVAAMPGHPDAERAADALARLKRGPRTL